MKKVLIISPHTDDAELGMGGTICKLRDEGVELMHIAFSIARRLCRKTCPMILQGVSILRAAS
jgi:hypothetical protein